MKIRCDLHVNGGSRKLVLMPGPNERADHLALKLAAYLLFWDKEPVVVPSAKHPALLGQEFVPDLMSLDITGAVDLWVECGATTMNKLDKVARRFTHARIVVLTPSAREAERLRSDVAAKLERAPRIEILAWKDGQFTEFARTLAEKTEVYGEAGGHMINAVVNERPVVSEFKPF